jgi:S1-C subfamily serine protease
MRLNRLIVPSVLGLGLVAGLAIAGESENLAPESVPEAIRSVAARIFKSEKVVYHKVTVYEVVGKDAKGAAVSYLVDQSGLPFEKLPTETTARGSTGRPFLGVQLAQKGEGAVIAEVVARTAAAAAELKAGDRIVKVGDTAVSSPQELIAAISRFAPGEKVALTIERDGWKKVVSATLGARKDDDGDDDDDDRGAQGMKKHHDERGGKDDDDD